MHIANNFLMRFIVENKSEVQSVTKKGSPGIGTGTSQENEVVVGVQIGRSAVLEPPAR
jgi:hypothetical protein